MSNWPRCILATTGIALALLTACGDDDSNAASVTDDPESTTAAIESTAATTGTQPEPTDESAPMEDFRDLLLDRGIAEITVTPTDETGPHPILSWHPIAGATSYWVVLQTSDGDATWAWVGANPSVRVGGGASGELNQTAAVYTDMQWVVSAFDADGNLSAVSRPVPIAP